MHYEVKLERNFQSAALEQILVEAARDVGMRGIRNDVYRTDCHPGTPPERVLDRSGFELRARIFRAPLATVNGVYRERPTDQITIHPIFATEREIRLFVERVYYRVTQAASAEGPLGLVAVG